MKPAYAKASVFAICYRRRALRYGGQDGGQVGSAASLRYLPSLKLRHDKKLRLGKPEGDGNADGGVVQGMSGEAAR